VRRGPAGLPVYALLSLLLPHPLAKAAMWNPLSAWQWRSVAQHCTSVARGKSWLLEILEVERDVEGHRHGCDRAWHACICAARQCIGDRKINVREKVMCG
jgi:hypothetical protein